MRSRGYEYTRIDGRRRLVCAHCRYPLTAGQNPPYSLPEPGMPRIDDEMKQAVCGPDYQALFSFIYPDSEVPDVPDGRMLDQSPVPWVSETPADEIPKILGDLPEAEFDLWTDAVDQARNSGGAETVLEAYSRLSGEFPPEVELTVPPDMAPVSTAR